MSIEQWKTAQAEWVEKNPIRQYRNQKGLTIMQLTMLVDATLMTVQRWETAGVEPRKEHAKKLQELIGNDFKTKWNAWKEQRPQL